MNVLPTSTVLIKIKSTQSRQYLLDGISWSLIIFNIFLTAYLATVGVNTDLAIAVKSIFMLMLTFGGLIGYMARYGKPKTDNTLTAQETGIITSSSIIGFVAIAMAQTLVLKGAQAVTSTLDVISQMVLGANQAIGEETFFRYFGQGSLEKELSKTAGGSASISAIVMMGLLFTAFHYVYSGQPTILLAVFASSIILGIVYTLTRRLSVVMLIHVLVNVVAVSAGLVAW